MDVDMDACVTADDEELPPLPAGHDGDCVSVVRACRGRHWQLRTTLGPNRLLLQHLRWQRCCGRLVVVLSAWDTERLRP